MKNAIKTLSFPLLFILFFLVSNKTEAAVFISVATENSQKSELKLQESNDAVCVSSRITTTVGHSTTNISKVFKQYFCSLHTKTKQLEPSVTTTVPANSIFSKNGSVRFAQTDIIFPFHYFW